MLANQLGTFILENKIGISSNISKRLNEQYNKFLNESNLKDQEIVNWRAKLIEFIANALISGDTNEVMDHVTEWARQTGESAVQYNIGVDELLQTNKIYREVLWDFVEKLNIGDISLKAFLKINNIIDSILDHTAYIFSVSYVRAHQNALKLIRDSALELSTPIVKINRDVAVLPLVGDIDTYRAKILLEQSIKKSADLGITQLIIDLSGVPIVDTMVANEIFQVSQALTLIGVVPTISGIRPEIAQAIVSLGLDFKNIQIKASLEQALSNKI